jgi:hypothetical protein
MTWFTENPTPLVLLGTFVASVAGFALIKTGSRAALYALLGTVALTIAGVVANVLIVTPREEVIATLEEIRSKVEANDPPQLLTYIDSSPTSPAIALRNRVQYDLANLTVEGAKINDLKVVVSQNGTAAKAEFIGVVDFKTIGNGIPPHFVLRFRVDLKRVGDRWLVMGADWEPLKLGGGGETAAPRPAVLVDDQLALDGRRYFLPISA